MRRLDRYISKELFVPLLTGILVIAALFAANELIAIFKNLNVRVLPAETIAQLVLLRMPKWLVLTFPVGMAIGASLAVGRLARETEITAMRAAGIPIRRVVFTVFLWGVAVALLNFFVAEKVQPAAAAQYRKVATEVFYVSAQPIFKADTTINLGRYKAQLGAIERKNDGSLVLRDIFLFEVLGAEELIIYQAPYGTYVDGVWKFPQAKMKWTRGDALTSFASKDVVLNEPIRVPDLMAQAEADEMTADDLKAAIKQRKLTGDPVLMLQVEYFNRFSVPASCIIFAITSAVVAVRFAKAGPFIGLMISLILVGVYFNYYVIASDIIGKGGLLPPDVSAWLPNLTYVILAALFYWRLE